MACSLAAGGSASPGARAGPEDVVARVNGRAILRRDFDLAVQRQFAGRRSGPVGRAELAAVRKTVLERLIDSELLYQRAERAGVAAEDEEVAAALRSFRAGLEASGGLEAFLEEHRMSETELLEQIRRSLIVARFIDTEVAGDIEVGDEELRRYYERNPGEMRRREAVALKQIVVRAPADASPAARLRAREKIEAILKELRAGGDFAELARRHSEGPGADRGGDVGLLIRGAGAPPAIERAAFQLAPGEISDVVETRLGYHILLAGERRPAGAIPFGEARERIRKRVTAIEREARIEAYVASLREAARIERLLEGGP